MGKGSQNGRMGRSLYICRLVVSRLCRSCYMPVYAQSLCVMCLHSAVHCCCKGADALTSDNNDSVARDLALGILSGMWHRVALVRIDVSEDVTTLHHLGKRIRELTFFLARWLSPWWSIRYLPSKCLFLQKPHGVTSQKTAFFIVTAVKTSNLT
jgi:hypothetical protein